MRQRKDGCKEKRGYKRSWTMRYKIKAVNYVGDRNTRAREMRSFHFFFFFFSSALYVGESMKDQFERTFD